MPVTGDTIVILPDGSGCQVCHVLPGMVLYGGAVVRTITVSQFTGWLYTISPHFIATGDTLVANDSNWPIYSEDTKNAKTIASKRHYATTDVYDFAFGSCSIDIFTDNYNAFWSVKLDNAPMQILRMPSITENEPDSNVYHRIWDAEAKVWRHELANYSL